MKKKRSVKRDKVWDSQKAPKARQVTVKESNTLLPFLFELLHEQSKSSVKMLLSKGQIAVNGKVTSLFSQTLVPEDVVTISYEKGKIEFNHPLLKIVWEDNDLIVVDKRSGLLSMATDRVKEKTAYHLLSEYVKKSDPHNRIFILHRLDRDTSGLMMFSKNRTAQQELQTNWNDMITDRSYVAVVEGRPQLDNDLIVSTLTENASMKVYVTATGGGQEAITRYKLIRTNERYSLLELTLETGRKNQIRAQMESIGNPIAGDAKYGARTNPAGRLALHARRLCFIHPTTREEMRFETSVPPSFNALVKEIKTK
ncbi:MAG: RluA family pseudouridine synthase [Tannerellaceae bacterium]